MSHDTYPESRPYTSYRYVYESGSESAPTEGDWRGFDEEWQALQYMDEERARMQLLANESDEPISQRIVDMGGFGSEHVIATEVIHPEIVSRPAFTRADRPTLGDLLVSTAKATRKVGTR